MHPFSSEGHVPRDAFKEFMNATSPIANVTFANVVTFTSCVRIQPLYNTHLEALNGTDNSSFTFSWM